MRGSGIYSDEFDYGDFACENDECLKDNTNAIAMVDDFGSWSVECEFCGTEFASGERDQSDNSDADYDAWRESQMD